MENFCKRFPHLAKSVFDQVDEQSLNLCKEISGDILEYLDSERFFWIKIIKKYQRRLKDFPKLWKLVIDKTPVERIKVGNLLPTLETRKNQANCHCSFTIFPRPAFVF